MISGYLLAIYCQKGINVHTIKYKTLHKSNRRKLRQFRIIKYSDNRDIYGASKC